jgi:hypothetical protein
MRASAWSWCYSIYFHPQLIFSSSPSLVQIVGKEEEEKILELKYHQNKTRKYIFNVLHVRKRNLKKHYITKHNSDSDSDIGVVCFLCGQMFGNIETRRA